MEKEQRERLEQELRFLKESLEADVISKEEYERGKERIERKLKEIEQQPEETSKQSFDGLSNQVDKKVESQSEEPIKEEIEIKEIKEKPTKIIGAETQPEIEEEIQEEKTEIKGEEKKEEKEPEEKIGVKEEKKPEEEPEEEITISKKWLYALAIIIIAAILFFSIRRCSKEGSIMEEEFIPECSSNSDCKQPGKVGTCINPGEKEAKCEFKEDVRTELLVINDPACSLCDSSRMKNTIRSLFPKVTTTDLDYNSEEAKELINELNIGALPAYIFDSEVTKTINFDNFKRALIKEGNNYIITHTASGASYYFKRPQIENKLDIFLTADIQEKVDSDLKEFTDLFQESNIIKNIVSEKDKTRLKEELGITSYPSFLINNQFKFGGFHSANSVKEKFCLLNKLDECKKELRKDLI